MEIVTLTREKYKAWDAFCLASDDAWFWHTTPWLEYTLQFRQDADSKSCSFFVMNNAKVAAICPLVLEENDGVKEFSYIGSYGFPPALDNNLTIKERNKAVNAIFNHIDFLADKHGVKRVLMRFPVLNPSFIEAPRTQSNYLMKFGFLDASLQTQVIDMRRPIVDLRREIRHGHDSDIDKASKILTAEIFDSQTITEEAFRGYLDLHHKDTGRAKRARATFDMMYDWIREGNAFLIGAKKGNMFVGFSYFFLYKNNAYYGSACNDPNSAGIPVAHFIQWEGIKWMHEHAIKFYEIGWQYYAQTLEHFPTEKEKSISKFKRGFGGFTALLPMGEKYYDKEYFADVYHSRIKKYADSLTPYHG